MPGLIALWRGHPLDGGVLFEVPSATHKLHRVVSVAEWQGLAAGLPVLEGFEPPTWLASSYLWAAVLADLYRRCGTTETAKRYRDVEFKSAPTPAVKELFQQCLGNGRPG